MSEIITITSQKGGCGKTTTALNLALALAEKGHKTLLVDVDPQGAVGHSLLQAELEHEGLAEIIAENREPSSVIINTKHPNLSLLSRGRLDAADVCDFELEIFRDDRLRSIISIAQSGFEYVLIDTPSGLGLASRAAMNAAQYALVPLQAEPLALRSVGQILRVIEHTRESSNPDLVLLGILPTMVAKKDEASMNVLIKSWRELGGVFDTVIPRKKVFVRASEKGVPLSYVAGKQPIEAKRFQMLAVEVTSRIEDIRDPGTTDEERPERRLL